MAIKLLLQEIAIAYFDQKTQEEIRALKAIAQAAAVVAENKGIELLAGGSDLVAALKFLE